MGEVQSLDEEPVDKANVSREASHDRDSSNVTHGTAALSTLPVMVSDVLETETSATFDTLTTNELVPFKAIDKDNLRTVCNVHKLSQFNLI